MLSLQKLSGLDDESPIHRHLGVVDELVAKRGLNWNEIHRFHLRNHVKKMTMGLFHFLRHPMQEICYATEAKIKKPNVEEYRDWLQRVGEPELAWLVSELMNKQMEVADIRVTMMWIVANLDLLKQEDKRNYRSIDDEWEV